MRGGCFANLFLRMRRRVLGEERGMESSVFSINESRILKVLEENRGSSLPELAVDAKLTPSAVREVVGRLAAKDLVRVADAFISLTPKGSTSRNLIVHQQAFTSLEDDDLFAHNERQVAFAHNEKDVDDALDAEIAKLEF